LGLMERLKGLAELLRTKRNQTVAFQWLKPRAYLSLNEQQQRAKRKEVARR
jgi:hypothetical protein